MASFLSHANILAGVLIFLVGFCFHWIGQMVSVLNWDFATRLGIQEKQLPAEYKVYEQAIAVADTAIAWLYGVAAVGLLLNAEWGYKLAWIPGSILTYHAISAWAWEANRRTAGHPLWSNAFRNGWCLANLISGLLALLVAWAGKTG